MTETTVPTVPSPNDFDHWHERVQLALAPILRELERKPRVSDYATSGITLSGEPVHDEHVQTNPWAFGQMPAEDEPITARWTAEVACQVKDPRSNFRKDESAKLFCVQLTEDGRFVVAIAAAIGLQPRLECQAGADSLAILVRQNLHHIEPVYWEDWDPESEAEIRWNLVLSTAAQDAAKVPPDGLLFRMLQAYTAVWKGSPTAADAIDALGRAAASMYEERAFSKDRRDLVLKKELQLAKYLDDGARALPTNPRGVGNATTRLRLLAGDWRRVGDPDHARLLEEWASVLDDCVQPLSEVPPSEDRWSDAKYYELGSQEGFYEYRGWWVDYRCVGGVACWLAVAAIAFWVNKSLIGASAILLSVGYVVSSYLDASTLISRNLDRAMGKARKEGANAAEAVRQSRKPTTAGDRLVGLFGSLVGRMLLATIATPLALLWNVSIQFRVGGRGKAVGAVSAGLLLLGILVGVLGFGGSSPPGAQSHKPPGEGSRAYDNCLNECGRMLEAGEFKGCSSCYGQCETACRLADRAEPPDDQRQRAQGTGASARRTTPRSVGSAWESAAMGAVLVNLPKVPHSATRPPTVGEWRAASKLSPDTGPMPDKCFIKVVRDWMRFHCEGAIDEPVGQETLGPAGTRFESGGDKYFDVVFRLKQGLDGRLSLKCNDNPVSLVVRWPSSTDQPQVRISGGSGSAAALGAQEFLEGLPLTAANLTGRWSVTTGLHDSAGSTRTTGTLSCAVEAGGAFECQDQCGLNAGRLLLTPEGGVKQSYEKLCGRPKTLTLDYQVHGASPDAFLLTRQRDEQKWVRASAPTPPSTVTSANDQLAPEDVGFVDRTRGRSWGDRCYLHIKAGNYAFARAACKAGLDMNPPDQWVHGALLYNMGLIAEKEGRLEDARSWYRKSLEVRPTGVGVSVVRAALQKLGGEP